MPPKTFATAAKKRPVLFFILWSILLLPCYAYGRDYRFTDAHLHYVNYAVQSQGFPALLAEMDRHKIERAIVFGSGYEISWPDIRPYRIRYYLDTETGTDLVPPAYFTKRGDYRLLIDYAKLSYDKRVRFFPFLQGIDANNRNEIYYIREMFESHPGLCGIGEIMIRGGMLNRLTPFTPQGDSIALDPILDFAAANRLPVIIRHDMAEEPPKPTKEPLEPIYLKEMIDLLSRHPNTIVIWAHAGIGRNIHIREHHILLKRLITAHPNLYIDLSWFAWENSIEKNLNAWVELITNHPDRFVLGSNKIGNFRSRIDDEKQTSALNAIMSSQSGNIGVGDALKRYIPLLKAIDRQPDGEAISDMITHRNINWILGRITNACKTGNPVIDPWKGGDPWKDPRYARPIMTVQLENAPPISISLHANYGDIARDIVLKGYRWHEKPKYTGIAESIQIEGTAKQGAGLFAESGFKDYIGYIDASRRDKISVRSVVSIGNWDEAFTYKNKDALFFPSGNWPTVPWWRNDKNKDIINKVRVPEGRRLILYDDEYFRGKVLQVIPATKGKFESLDKVTDKVRSFQFVPES
ncbi:MAG: amidohydrolase [Syntrophobacterales bacterium]|jgi:predicted TIM-barrel fold metal-dependent hydrolase|nr:amidohydrolase [Syntrophobacterales bacterium]